MNRPRRSDPTPLRTGSGSLLLSLLLCACGTEGGGGVDAGYQRGAVPGTLEFGEVCDGGVDCVSELCLPVAQNLSVCTERCDPATEPGVCPDADSWGCEGHDDEPVVCRCRADSFVEKCADGIDNDCDGVTDDCQECGALLVPLEDPNHCGECGRRCKLGSSCDEGTCVCPDGTRGEPCLAQRGDAECEFDAQCEDSIDCTADLCNEFGRCLHNVVPARCAAGEVCNLLAGGCQPGRACASSDDCYDEDACTSGETCDPATRVCLWVPLDGDSDGQPPRVCGGADCNDDQAQTFYGAYELCDGIDNNCDGEVDVPLAPDACPFDRKCVGGSCQCTRGRLDCSGACVDGDTDEQHCGSCGNRCVPGASCVGGQCECDDGDTRCADGCFDLQTDADNCGACGRSCTYPYEVCVVGRCRDIDECAAGTFSCQPNSHCEDGVPGYGCVCDDGYRAAGNDCLDIDECAAGTDDCFSGGCRNTAGGYTCECPTGLSGDGMTCACDAGVCGAHGACGQVDDLPACICDPGYAHDGATVCALADACRAGLEADRAWCTNYCADLLTDADHCGACGVDCGPGGSCSGGSCTCAAGMGTTLCSNSGCVDLQTDERNCGGCDATCGGVCVGGGCKQFVQVVGGMGFSCALTDIGTVYCWGSRANGRLGDGSTSPGTIYPQLNATLAAAGAVTRIAAGPEHACALLQGGSLYCWGESANGEASQSAASAASTPTQLATDVTDMALGTNHTCVVLTGGEIQCRGADNLGQHGDGAGTTNSLTWSGPALLTAPDEIVAGDDHTCVRKAGKVHCWGDSAFGQAGLGDFATAVEPGEVAGLSNVTSLDAGSQHTCAALPGGTVQCWGNGSSFRLGRQDTSAVSSPVAVAGISTAASVALGGGSSCALLQNGDAVCWGANTYQQLGIGSSVDVWTPTKVPGLLGLSSLATGAWHGCAAESRGVRCWGYGYGAGGGATTTVSLPTPLPFP